MAGREVRPPCRPARPGLGLASASGAAEAGGVRHPGRGLAVTAAWSHLRTFGGLTPYSTNVVWSGEGTAAIVASHLGWQDRGYRLFGLFLDARFGLFRWLPASVLALWGITRRALLATAVVATCVVVGTFLAITMMGWWFPGRMLVAGFPALAVLVALGFARLPRTGVVLGAWSLAIAAAVVWAARTGAVRLAVDPFTLGFPLPPSWAFPDFRHFTTTQVLQSAAWIGALAALRWRTRRSRGLSGRHRRRPARSMAVG